MTIAYLNKSTPLNIDYDKWIEPSTLDIAFVIMRMGNGDTLIIDDIVTAAPCIRSLYKILKLIENKGIYLYCIKQNISSQRKDGKILITSILRLYERDIEHHRTLTINGMMKSPNKGGRPRTSAEKIQSALDEYNNHDKAVKDILVENEISSAVFYRALKKRNMK